MRSALIAVLLAVVTAGAAAEGAPVDLDRTHRGFSGRFDDWLISASHLPGAGWLVMATTAAEQPVLLVDDFWDEADREDLPAGLAARVDDLLRVAELPLRERAAAMRGRHGRGWERLCRGGGFSRGVAGKYMHYCYSAIGPHRREWVVVVRDFSAATLSGDPVYSGPPETPSMQEVLSEATCDAILGHIDDYRGRWDEQAEAFRARLEAFRARLEEMQAITAP